MKVIKLSGRRSVAAICILLSACAAGPGEAGGQPAPDAAYGAYLAARYADATGDEASAAHYYAVALRTQTQNQELVAEGFLAAVLAGDDDAVALAPQLPGNALAALLLGNQAMRAGKFDQAAQIYQGLPQDDLSGLIKPLLLAWADFGQGNEQAALNGLGPYFTNNDFGQVYVLNAALIADAAGDAHNAAPLYGAVDNSTPNLRLAQIVASWEARQGQNGMAQAELGALVAAHPELGLALPALQQEVGRPVIGTAAQGVAEAYLTLAGSLTQPQAAFLRTVFLRFALDLRPDLTAARLLLAETQTSSTDKNGPSQMQLQNALATLAPIAPGDPLYAPAALAQANDLAALNRFDEAAALLRGLLAADPGNAGLLANLADMLRQGGKNAEALPCYNQAIAALGPNPPGDAWSLYFDRGISEDAMGRWDLAAPDMQTALSLSPGQPYVLNYVAYTWALHGEKLAQAHEMLARAVALDPNDGAVIDSLGFVELKQGRTREALKLLIQAVQLDPDDPEVNGHLGDAFWQAGLALQADYQWQRALALHPEAKLAAGLRAKIAQHFGGAA